MTRMTKQVLSDEAKVILKTQVTDDFRRRVKSQAAKEGLTTMAFMIKVISLYLDKVKVA